MTTLEQQNKELREENNRFRELFSFIELNLDRTLSSLRSRPITQYDIRRPYPVFEEIAPGRVPDCSRGCNGCELCPSVFPEETKIEPFFDEAGP